MRQPCDQIEIDLTYTSHAHTRNLRVALCFCVETSNCGTLAIDKGLNAKTDPVHSLPQQLVQRLSRKLARRALKRDLRAVGNIELAAQMLEYLPKLRRRKQTRGSTAEVDGVD